MTDEDRRKRIARIDHLIEEAPTWGEYYYIKGLLDERRDHVRALSR